MFLGERNFTPLPRRLVSYLLMRRNWRRRHKVSGDSPLLNGLVAHWRFENDFLDAQGSNHLTKFNGVTFVDGKFLGGKAAQFVPDTQDYLATAGDSTPLQMASTGFTLTAWLYLDAVSNCAYAGKVQGPGNLEYYLGHDSGICLFVSGDGSNGYIVRDLNEYETGTWMFVAGWYDLAAHTINIQLNNDTVTSAAGPANVFAGIAPLNLGRHQANGTYMAGRLDSVSIWKRILSAGERTQLFNAWQGLDYPFANP